MGIPVLRGRSFVESDARSDKQPVIVDEVLAKQLWPGVHDPTGKVIYVDSRGSSGTEPTMLTVAGLVGSVTKQAVKRILGAGSSHSGQFYLLADVYEERLPRFAPFFAVRIQGSATTSAKELRRHASELGHVSLSEILSMETRWMDFPAETRFYT